MYGVRLTFSVGGKFEILDRNAIFLNLSAGLVFLSIPAKIILFLAANGLGVLSKIYNRHLYEKCSIERDIKGWVARMVAMLTNYHDMRDVKNGVSWDMFHRRLQRIFKHSEELDEIEISNMSSFVYDKLAVGTGEDGKDTLDLDEFVYAMSSGEKIHPKDLGVLFDSERKTGVLEQIFPDLKHDGIYNAKNGIKRLSTRSLKHLRAAGPQPEPELAEADEVCVSLFHQASKRRSASPLPDASEFV
jgi:hypothetical protein